MCSGAEPVVGIDLGTTYSCISYYDGTKSEVIADNFGDRIIPSFVYYDPFSGEVFVGDVAVRKSVNCSANGLRDSKRLIGRMYNDEFIERYANMRQIPFKIVKTENNMAAFSVQINGDEVVKLPEEISAEILKYLVKMAEHYLMKDVKKAVISIPAYFSNAQRKATMKAAELAGIQVLKLITEPTAAAIHYLRNKKSNSKVMVFDWGGGTLDVSLIRIKDEIFEVKAVYGYPLLGGRNIDDKLFDYFYVPVKSHQEKFNRRLLHACLRIKEDLSVLNEAEAEVDDGEDDINIRVTRERFNSLLEDIFQEVSDIITYALTDSGWSASAIDQVILVGGSSRILKVTEILRNTFGSEKLKFDLNPEEAVAIGAAMQAYLLQNFHDGLENYRTSEVTPLSLGTSVGDGVFTTILKKNSRLPASKTKKFVTAYNDQIEMRIDVYEGERKICKYNNKLGECIVHNLPPKRAGDVEVMVTFYLNEDGILNVTATECSTGETNSLTVTMGEFRLSDRKVKFSFLDSEKQQLEDDTFEAFSRRKDKLLEQCQHVLYDLDKISDESDRKVVSEACEDFVIRSFVIEFTEIEKLEECFKEMYDKILDILKLNDMLQIEDIDA